MIIVMVCHRSHPKPWQLLLLLNFINGRSQLSI
jgi:hypothetical protein